MSNKELLPCPFCGGETKIDNRGQYGYGIVCISCGAKSPDFQTETNAIKSWNDYANDLFKTELKPCPFCNGIAEVDCRLSLCSVVCKDCGARVSSFGDVDPAIKAWNKRVDVAKTDESCEKSCKEEK